MQHPDEGMIHTWLDGELSAEDAAALEAHVAECAPCAVAVAEARGLIAGSSRIVSFLDSVPAGVIPEARPAHRSWYSTTQFRAAAAFLLVAGSSLLVVRRNETKADKLMAVAAPPAVATDAMSAAAAAPAPFSGKTAVAGQTAVPKKNPASPGVAGSLNGPVAGKNAPVAGKNAPVEDSRTESILNRASAIAGVAGSATPSKVAASMPAIQDSGARAASTIAGLAAETALKLIRTDSLRGVTNTVFEMTNGIQLIMTERDPLAFSTGATQSTSGRELSVSPKVATSAAPALPRPLAKDEVKFSDYRTITWVDAATGRRYSLTGPLPPDQLEKFKALVVKLSR
jgi:putative zinc finger protein